MGWWQVEVDTLAGGRFGTSVLAEVTACTQVLEWGGGRYPAEREWRRRWLPGWRAAADAEPVGAAVLRAGLGGAWNADFLTPAPRCAGEGFAAELEPVLRTGDAQARADLAVSLAGAAPPAELRAAGLAERAAALLGWVWEHTVAPDWERRRRLLEADVQARTARLADGGWAAALEGMRPGVRWLGGGRLGVNPRDLPPREVADRARLLFVPVTPSRGWVSWHTPQEGPHRYAVVYPCSGAARPDRPVPPESLAALLGRGRAGVLVLLESSLSTTQLVALSGLALGSVGRHLRVLLDAGLVGRRRSGRSVLYEQTAAARTLLAAAGTAAAPTSRPPCGT